MVYLSSVSNLNRLSFFLLGIIRFIQISENIWIKNSIVQGVQVQELSWLFQMSSRFDNRFACQCSRWIIQMVDLFLKPFINLRCLRLTIFNHNFCIIIRFQTSPRGRMGLGA
jgi:hypothetical protein